jgi:hypothetical protein
MYVLVAFLSDQQTNGNCRFTLRAPTRVGSNRWSFFLIGAKLQNEDSLAKSPEAFEHFFHEATGRTDVVFSNWDYLTVHRYVREMFGSRRY